MSKQLTFPRVVTVTAVYPDGKQEKIRYGHYESVRVVKENGYDVHRTKKLHAARYPVTNIELENGTKLLFDESIYTIEQSGQGQPDE
jgi:hypothetical protein